MKIAICLSGLPRQYKAGYEELKKWFLDRYDCDVYLHTWYDTQSTFHTGHKFSPKISYQFTEKNYNELLELYQPKNYTFQKPIPFDVNGIISKLGVKLNVSLSSFYSLQHSFNLIKESGIEYDYIIRSKTKTKAGALMSRQAHMELAIKDKLNANLGEVIFYVNNGTKASHGDVQKVNKPKKGWSQEHIDNSGSLL